jgi:excisionase family DNA binding protein
MTTRETANYLRVKERTLYEWRMTAGLPYSVLGGSVRYERAAVDEWVDACSASTIRRTNCGGACRARAS